MAKNAEKQSTLRFSCSPITVTVVLERPSYSYACIQFLYYLSAVINLLKDANLLLECAVYMLLRRKLFMCFVIVLGLVLCTDFQH